MSEWFLASPKELLAIALTSIGIYISLILITRISGKRSFSKMSSFDFAITVAIGSILATAILSKSVSLIQGVVGLVVVYAIQMTVAYLRRFAIIAQIVDNKPLLLMKKETILHENLKKAKITESDLKAKLREANVTQLAQVKAVVFESTGDISVLHAQDKSLKLEDYLLDGVQV
ncbi:DUF421 domain-containing protein [Croceivirga lutea]|uniref:DUF421 domain-containing protein n=1 Tax=Croceivirga lutea TaxID=1775167 RepID=UPI00163B1444|nr:YetF domain-containing protein [Croceivirga lutea]GGG53305.1 DUF421 domain-containing protein [Croceivirga lutea]